MKKMHKALFSVQKIFYGHDLQGQPKKYIEGIAYFTNLKDALAERTKHTQSFVFPFKCHFHKDRRKTSTILRANFH